MALPTTDDKPSNSISYTKLPAEIWLQICGLVVTKNQDSIIICKDERPSPHVQERTRLALASTCRWMYELATSVYYGKNRFSISHVPDFPSTHLPRFFACIGSRNVNLITSLVLECRISIWDKIPLQQISAMTEIRDIEVRYEGYRDYKGYILGTSRPVYSPGRLQPANYAIVYDYGKFIESLSYLSNESGENVKRFTWTLRHDLLILPKFGGRGWVLDWQSWMSFEDLDQETERSDPGFVMNVQFSWGLVKASIGLQRMRIHMKREYGKVIGPC